MLKRILALRKVHMSGTTGLLGNDANLGMQYPAL